MIPSGLEVFRLALVFSPSNDRPYGDSAALESGRMKNVADGKSFAYILERPIQKQNLKQLIHAYTVYFFVDLW